MCPEQGGNVTFRLVTLLMPTLLLFSSLRYPHQPHTCFKPGWGRGRTPRDDDVRAHVSD